MPNNNDVKGVLIPPVPTLTTEDWELLSTPLPPPVNAGGHVKIADTDANDADVDMAASGFCLTQELGDIIDGDEGTTTCEADGRAEEGMSSGSPGITTRDRPTTGATRPLPTVAAKRARLGTTGTTIHQRAVNTQVGSTSSLAIQERRQAQAQMLIDAIGAAHVAGPPPALPSGMARAEEANNATNRGACDESTSRKERQLASSPGSLVVSHSVAQEQHLLNTTAMRPRIKRPSMMGTTTPVPKRMRKPAPEE